jgi:hypothetical protein
LIICRHAKSRAFARLMSHWYFVIKTQEGIKRPSDILRVKRAGISSRKK